MIRGGELGCLFCRQLGVGKIEVGLPVGGGDIVGAGAEQVGEWSVVQLIWGRLGGDAEAAGAEQTIDRVGSDQTEKLAFGIGPEVFGGAGDEQRAWGDEGDQLVLIDRAVGLAAIPFFISAGEPVREGSIDAGHGFAEDTAAEGGAPAS